MEDAAANEIKMETDVLVLKAGAAGCLAAYGAREQGARVIIGGLSIPFRDRGFGKGFRNLADETDATLIPNILEGIMGNRKLMSDPIHPNDAGYKIMAERFYKAILS